MEDYREEVVTTKTTTSAPPVVRESIPVATPAIATTERTEQVTVDPYGARRYALYRTEQVIWLILSIVDGLIALRFILRLLGANPAAGFAQFMYGITAPLIAPFVGLFPSPRFEGSVLEVTSLVAMIVYVMLAWVLVTILRLVFNETRTGVITQRTDTRVQ